MRKEFRPYTFYAPKEVFEEKHEKGFEEVAFSLERGLFGPRWVDPQRINFVKAQRINKLCAFYDLKGKIETYEHVEYNQGSFIKIGTPFSELYNDSEIFQKHLRDYNIKLGERKKLITILEEINLQNKK